MYYMKCVLETHGANIDFYKRYIFYAAGTVFNAAFLYAFKPAYDFYCLFTFSSFLIAIDMVTKKNNLLYSVIYNTLYT